MATTGSVPSSTTTTTLSSSSVAPPSTTSSTTSTSSITSTTSSPTLVSSTTSSSTTQTSTTDTHTIATTPPTTTAPNVVTSILTQTPTSATTVLITSTAPLPLTSNSGSSTASSSSTTSGLVAAASTTTNTSSGGLSPSGTIAVAVVVPVVGVALIALAALWFWRKRKARKLAEEERRKEVEEYGYNPNNDPTLPAVGLAGAYGESYEPKEDVSGYRGWGTTSAGRKASMNLSSGPGVGIALSDGDNAPGYHHAVSSSDGTVHYAEGLARPYAEESDPVGVLGRAAAASYNRPVDIRRGPSNASSAYSAANHSDASDDSHMAGGYPAANDYDDNPYYHEVQQPYVGYGDGAYDGGQPVIRDVLARRNTQIENPSVFPGQGNAGIAQNF